MPPSVASKTMIADRLEGVLEQNFVVLAHHWGMAGAWVCFIGGTLCYFFEAASFWESVAAGYCAVFVAGFVFLLELGQTNSTFLGKVDSSLPFAVVEWRRTITTESCFPPSIAKALLYIACCPPLFARWSLLLWPGLHLLVVALLYLGDVFLQRRPEPDYAYDPVGSADASGNYHL